MLFYLRIKNWIEDQKGQDLIEYALLVVLVAIVGGIIYTTMSGDLQTIYQSVSNAVADAVGEI